MSFLSEENNRPKVGVGILIFKENKILLGKRKGSHGEGIYSLPGGYLEYGESVVGSSNREIAEEAGIKVKKMRFLCLVNLKDFLPKHYVEIGMVAEWESGEPTVMEPDKCEGWGWYDLWDLPQPQFPTLGFYLETYRLSVENGVTPEHVFYDSFME